MGIDRDLADFLLCAKNAGVDFRDSVTLGRLNLFADVRSLKAVFEKHGIRLSEDDIASIRGASGGYAEEFLCRLGARDPQSLDASAYEGASLLHDMNFPIDDARKRRFSVVIDGGTLEHIFNFPTAMRNCMEMLKVGGHFFTQTMANNFMGHGFYQFSPELFYRVLSPENGFRVHRILLYESRIGRPRWFEAFDPQTIGERVELINGRPTYMMVHAERIADVPLFVSPPQQADYSTLWKSDAPHQASASGIRRRVQRWAKPYNELFLRCVPGPLYDLLLSTLLRGLPRRGFRRRHYASLRTLKG